MTECDTSSKKYLDEMEWYYNVNLNDYIKLDDWMNEFNELIEKLEIRLEKVKLMAKEDLNTDMERLNKLETSNV